MKDKKVVLVSGATGLVGRALCRALKAQGHEVRTLSRSSGDFTWDVDVGQIDAGAVAGTDVVVHLAGEPVAQRWTREVKRRIRDSRVEGASILVQEILRQAKPPILMSASGTNYYGFDCGEGVDESSASGAGFLAEVCREWEGAAQPLVDAGVRTVFVRTGMVLSAEGGALGKLLPIFKAGLGGRVGSGKQWMSWVGLDDLVQVYLEGMRHPDLDGPINTVAPKPVRNADFAKALGRAVRRPACCPVPAAALRVLYGEMANETILSDVGVYPMVLHAEGFQWQTPTLEQALERCLPER